MIKLAFPKLLIYVFVVKILWFIIIFYIWIFKNIIFFIVLLYNFPNIDNGNFVLNDVANNSMWHNFDHPKGYVSSRNEFGTLLISWCRGKGRRSLVQLFHFEVGFWKRCCIWNGQTNWKFYSYWLKHISTYSKVKLLDTEYAIMVDGDGISECQKSCLSSCTCIAFVAMPDILCNGQPFWIGTKHTLRPIFSLILTLLYIYILGLNILSNIYLLPVLYIILYFCVVIITYIVG